VQVSRGVAVGDYDNDGDVDIAVSNNGQAPALLRNDSNTGNHWLAVKLRGAGPPLSNRDAVGARVKVTAGDLTQVDEVISGSGYMSQSDLRLFFGLGQRREVDYVTVRWPSGIVQTVHPEQVDAVITVDEPRRQRD
jgi:hypothetical protein